MDIIEALKIVYPKEFIRHVPSDDSIGSLFFGEDIKKLISPLKIVNKINHTDIVMLANKFTSPSRGPKNTSYSTYYKEAFVREMIKDHLPRVQSILDKPKPNIVPSLVTPFEVSKSAAKTTHIDSSRYIPEGWVTMSEIFPSTLSNVLLTSDKLKSMVRNAFPDELFVENLFFGKEPNSYRSSLFLPKYNISFELPNFKCSPETRCDFSRRTNTRCISIADETTFGGDLVEAMRNFSVSIGVANSLIQKYLQGSTD